MSTNIRAIAIGRLVPVKRFDVLIEAWRAIPNPLTIVGDGPERDKLVAQVNGYALQDRVKFVGERSCVVDLLTNHQLLVVTSEREGFGYVILEALQAKKVVVSTTSGIAPELLPDKYLVSTLSADVVASTVQRTLSEFEHAKHEFVPVWNRARDLTIEKMVSETLIAYRETLSLQQRRSPRESNNSM